MVEALLVAAAKQGRLDELLPPTRHGYAYHATVAEASRRVANRLADPSNSDRATASDPELRPVGVQALEQQPLTPLERPRRSSRGWAVAAAAAAVAVVLAMSALTRDGDDTNVTTRPGPSTTTRDPGDTDGADMPFEPAKPGSVVVTGAELRTFRPDGQPNETHSLAPILNVQSVTSDGHGGYVACGDGGDATFWFRPGRDPKALSINATCTADALHVTSIDDREVLGYISQGTGQFELLDLTTGETSPTPVDGWPATWSAGGGRVAGMRDDGLEAWDLATGEQIPVGPVPFPAHPVSLPVSYPEGPITSNVALSTDGATVAALIGEVAGGPSDVVVADLATGAELFRATVPVNVEGGQLAYDGTTVAVGSYYDSPVHIFDVATGAEATVNAHGTFP
jgi:hypothetical protein